MARETFEIFRQFFAKKGIVASLSFLLLYRFGEAQLVKVAPLFMGGVRADGGLGLSTGEFGYVYGTFGVLALTIGGILGGIACSRKGLKFWLWPMVIAINLPDAVYVFLSHAQPESMTAIALCVIIEQFGYGFGFTSYMLYMIYISEGKYKTAHFAITTAFMALGMMLPGMFSGYLQETLGYGRFFVWVLISTSLSFLVTGLIKVDPGFGKEEK